MKNKNLLLAADVGNSNITIGFFSKSKIIKRLNIPTKSSVQSLARFIKRDAKYTESAIVSSVVPQASLRLKKALKVLNINSSFIGKEISVPIKNLYKNPKQVGRDRLVNAYAVKILYGYPAIIVDFGTATTFDYIDTNGAYSGGIITPGVEISIEALYKKTALLPKIKLTRPKSLIGKDTVESIKSGTLFGLSGLCDGIVERIRKRHSKKSKVVATGGLASFFAPYCKYVDCIDKDLTLKGLNLIYNKFK